MNCFTVAAKMRRQLAKIDVELDEMRRNLEDAQNAPRDAYGLPPTPAFDIDWDKLKESRVKLVMDDFEKTADLACMLMAKMREKMAEHGISSTNYYFITIRPADTTPFNTLYEKTSQLLERSCFIESTTSFEQKGTSPETLGQGAHVHIVAAMKQRSKAEVLRDVASTMKDVCEKNFVDVQTTRNPQTIIDKYLKNYESEDGHKEVTKEWDTLWRQRMGLQHIYNGKLPKIRFAILTAS